MFHVRRRPADSQPRRRKKKPLGVSNGNSGMSAEREGPMLIEITHAGDGGRRVKLTSEPIEVGSANTNALQLFGPSIQPRHCLISLHEGVCTVTPLHADGLTFVNGHHITQPTILHVRPYFSTLIFFIFFRKLILFLKTILPNFYFFTTNAKGTVNLERVLKIIEKESFFLLNFHLHVVQVK